jgi:hypothetical protein
MAVIAASAIPKTGLIFTTVLTYTPAAGGDRVPPGSLLIFRNTNASGLVVTIATLDTADGDLVVADRAQTSIPATTGTGIVNIPIAWPYVDPTDGLVLVTTSVQTSVSFACVNP